MKKIIALIIILCMILSSASAFVFAEESDKVVRCGIGIAEVNSEVTVPIVMIGSVKAKNLGITIGYDSSKVELVNVVNKQSNTYFVCSQNNSDNPFILSWTNGSGFDIESGHTIAELTFKIKEGCMDSIPLEISFYKGRTGNYVDGKNINFGEDNEPLNLKYNDGCIVVHNPEKTICCVSKYNSDGKMSSIKFCTVKKVNSVFGNNIKVFFIDSENYYPFAEFK